MAAYTGQQRFLLRDAQRYTDLGYRVGLCKGKVLLRSYKAPTSSVGWFGIAITAPADNGDNDFDGISIIPDEIVCVDIDVPDFGVVYEALPPTWKERTPRGWHLWYRLPLVIGQPWLPQIQWRKHVDLLTKAGTIAVEKKFRSVYGSSKNDDDEEDEPKGTQWGGHVLCSNTTGYQRMWPDETPAKSDLPLAPQWLQDALLK